MNDVRFYKLLIWANALIPLALLGYDATRGHLGANPVEFFLRTTGVLTLVFLFVTLAVTPLRRVTGINELIKYRRVLGLFAFFYGCTHLVTYTVFDRGLSLSGTVEDVVQRPFIAILGGAVRSVQCPSINDDRSKTYLSRFTCLLSWFATVAAVFLARQGSVQRRHADEAYDDRKFQDR